jgi:ppGpp synthetase/RelA/SpoT-type nucleotidyltranferase
MPLPISKKQVRQIGKMLASEAMHPSSLLYQPYQDFMAHCDSEQVRLENLLKDGLDSKLSISGRRKSRNTLREKLQALSTMQLTHIRDLVGVRIVGEMTLDQQDQLANEFVEKLGIKTELVDRRIKPNNGYRALHIEVKLDGITGEIQIRTPLQSAWADSFERLADKWGRQIRYGDPPNLNSSGENEDRINIVMQFIELSTKYIMEFEMKCNNLARSIEGATVERTVPKIGSSRRRIISAMRNRQAEQKVQNLTEISQVIVKDWQDLLLVELETLALKAEKVE